MDGHRIILQPNQSQIRWDQVPFTPPPDDEIHAAAFKQAWPDKLRGPGDLVTRTLMLPDWVEARPKIRRTEDRHQQKATALGEVQAFGADMSNLLVNCEALNNDPTSVASLSLSIGEAFNNIAKLVQDSNFFTGTLFSDDNPPLVNGEKIYTDIDNAQEHGFNIAQVLREPLTHLFEAMDAIITHFDSEPMSFTEDEITKKDNVLDLLAQLAEKIFNKFEMRNGNVNKVIDYETALSPFGLRSLPQVKALFEARSQAKEEN